MQKKITESTTQNALGLPSGRLLLKVPSGAYAGRAAALIQTAGGEIKLYYADSPYSSWSAPITIATDAVDDAFSAAINSGGNIHIVYTEITTEYLVTKKLSFSSGTWTVGGKVTIFNGNPSYYATVDIETGGRIWVCYTLKNGALRYIYAKSSDDDGATWGAGIADSGDSISTGHTSAWAKFVIGPNDLFVVYSGNATDLWFSQRPISGGNWTTPFKLASTGNFDAQLDISVSSEGLLGVVYDNDQLLYREYDGSNWGSSVTLDGSGGLFPQIIFFENVPVITYLQQFAGGQYIAKQTNRQSGSFSTPTALDSRADTIDKVILYDAVSTTFSDLTTEAASSTSADLFHPSTNALAKTIGDEVYLGMDSKFRFLRFILSTAGVGGTVSYSYWDGTVWKAFTPVSGNFNLNATDEELILWTDFESMASDWQLSSVNGSVLFWVRLKVDTAFTTAPVGSQITAISNLLALSVRR